MPSSFLAGAVADEEPELGDAIVKIHHQVADLLGCFVEFRKEAREKCPMRP
jgi:hypothetical protein